MLIRHPNDQPLLRAKALATPRRLQGLRQVWEPLTHRSPPGAAQRLSPGEAGEGRQNRKAAQHRFTFPGQRAGMEGAGDLARVPEPRSSQRGEGALCSCAIAPWHFLQPER